MFRLGSYHQNISETCLSLGKKQSSLPVFVHLEGSSVDGRFKYLERLLPSRWKRTFLEPSPDSEVSRGCDVVLHLIGRLEKIILEVRCLKGEWLEDTAYKVKMIYCISGIQLSRPLPCIYFFNDKKKRKYLQNHNKI